MNTKTKKPSFFSGLTGQILIAMVLGAILGIVIHNSISAEAAQGFSAKVKILATIFIRLVK
jgi:Na+/H+-dicarboxylate symporter